MPSEAVDDDAVHFGKLVDSEVLDPGLDLVPGSAVVPDESVVGWFENVVRFQVQDNPSVGEGVARGFEDCGILPDGIEEGGPYRVIVRAGRGHFHSQLVVIVEEDKCVGFGPQPVPVLLLGNSSQSAARKSTYLASSRSNLQKECLATASLSMGLVSWIQSGLLAMIRSIASRCSR